MYSFSNDFKERQYDSNILPYFNFFINRFYQWKHVGRIAYF